jgi:hypothetical protein
MHICVHGLKGIRAKDCSNAACGTKLSRIAQACVYLTGRAVQGRQSQFRCGCRNLFRPVFRSRISSNCALSCRKCENPDAAGSHSIVPCPVGKAQIQMQQDPAQLCPAQWGNCETRCGRMLLNCALPTLRKVRKQMQQDHIQLCPAQWEKCETRCARILLNCALPSGKSTEDGKTRCDAELESPSVQRFGTE